jgi:hypothetical protein
VPASLPSGSQPQPPPQPPQQQQPSPPSPQQQQQQQQQQQKAGGLRIELPADAAGGARGPDTPSPAGASPGPSEATLAGVTVPRMSNAFLRRYGLNPKDSPLTNLQRIMALHSQNPQQVLAAMQAEAGGGTGPRQGRPPRHARGARQRGQQQGQLQQQQQGQQQQGQQQPPPQPLQAQYEQQAAAAALQQRFAYAADLLQHDPQAAQHAQQLQLQLHSQVPACLAYGLGHDAAVLHAHQLHAMQLAAAGAGGMGMGFGGAPLLQLGGAGGYYPGDQGLFGQQAVAAAAAAHNRHSLLQLFGQLGVGGGGDGGGRGADMQSAVDMAAAAAAHYQLHPGAGGGAMSSAFGAPSGMAGMAQMGLLPGQGAGLPGSAVQQDPLEPAGVGAGASGGGPAGPGTAR